MHESSRAVGPLPCCWAHRAMDQAKPRLLGCFPPLLLCTSDVLRRCRACFPRLRAPLPLAPLPCNSFLLSSRPVFFLSGLTAAIRLHSWGFPSSDSAARTRWRAAHPFAPPPPSAPAAAGMHAHHLMIPQVQSHLFFGARPDSRPTVFS